MKAINITEIWPGHHQCSLGMEQSLLQQDWPLQKILYNTHCPWISLANLLCASSRGLATESQDIFSLIALLVLPKQPEERWRQALEIVSGGALTSCVFDCTCSLTNRKKLYHLQQVQIIRETNDISTYVAGNFSFLWQRLSPAIIRPKVSQLFPFCSLI